MGHHRTPADRLAALGQIVGSRPASGPPLADHPDGQEIARQLAIVADLLHSTDPGDVTRRILAAERGGALLVYTGDTQRDMLAYIAQHEDAAGLPDPEFWAAVGGRPTVRE